MPRHRSKTKKKQTRTISRAIYDISRKADAALAEKMKKDALNLLLGTMQNHTSQGSTLQRLQSPSVQRKSLKLD